MQITGVGTRALNFIVDTLLIFLLAWASFRGWNFYVIYWGYTPHNFAWFFYGILFVYYFFFEAIFTRTPGKWLSYSKVVTREGKRPGLGWIFIRSLTRLILIDMFFIPFLGKPLHDYLSKTILVEI